MKEKTERLVSIDFFRGITVAAMILVNNPGSWDYVYPPLKHAHWNGCTPTDLVFPFFLFIVGLSINFSLAPLKQSGLDSGKIYFKIVKRSLLLFSLGLLIAAFPFTHLEGLRIPGVLQRISIVFLFCALMFLSFSQKTQIAVTILILIGYWALVTLVPIPGGTAPNLEPGLNLGAWLDRFLLSGHLWAHTKTWDPEGVLSTLPAIASGMTGIFAGNWMRQQKSASQKLIWLLISGTILVLIGLLWDLVFPINKSLWTSSYVLFTSGLALFALAISYWMIDGLSMKKFAQPFIYFGSNAITIYVASEIFTKIFYIINIEGMDMKSWLFNSLNSPLIGPFNVSLLLAISWMMIFFFVAWLMHKRKIFIKV